MITIRTCIFETNSSSIHTLAVMKKEDFRRWYNSSDEEPNDEALFFIKHKDGNKSTVTFITEKKVKEDLLASSNWITDEYLKAIDENSLYKAKEMLNLYAVWHLGAYPSGWFGDVAYEEFDDYVAVSVYIPEQ